MLASLPLPSYEPPEPDRRGHTTCEDESTGDRLYCGWIPIAVSGRWSSIGEEPRRDRAGQYRTGTKT